MTSDGDGATRWLYPAIRHLPLTTRRLKAILPVDISSQPANMNPIRQVAERHDLFIIKDTCQAIRTDPWDC